ncbi:glycerophosphodiester phosphodiesterase [Synechococcus sp. H60.2]|uniref:glycerophosphodiester phosphodiesterase n=1 Tax=Synechococcus sp. H60.2 TaxID=2964518 RepID=UPI0039C25330
MATEIVSTSPAYRFPTRIVAHRGDHTHAEENTLAAFAAAIEGGADGIELDVRRSRDGIPLIFHDAELEGQPLAALTWAEIRARKPTIPTLEEVLLQVGGKIALDLELKEAGYEEQVLALISKQLSPDACVLTSFLPQVVGRLKELLHRGSSAPPFQVGLLVEAQSEEEKGSPLAYCRELGADFLAPHYSWLNLPFLAAAAQARIPLYVWTVNDPEIMAFCLRPPVEELPVQGLITDRPQLALQIRAQLWAAS